MNIQVFIISWKDQHENAVTIYEQILALQVPVRIIFSDPNSSYNFPPEILVIRRENQLFWGDKFKACMEFADLKNTLIIHADCTYKNWAELLLGFNIAINNIPQLGVYAPITDFTSFPVKRTSIMELQNTVYTAVCFIDCIVFGISTEVLKRMKSLNYDQNIPGWGIAWILASFSLTTSKFLIIDNSIKINHPKSRGYNSEDALEQMSHFLMQATNSERVLINLIRNHLEFKK